MDALYLNSAIIDENGYSIEGKQKACCAEKREKAPNDNVKSLLRLRGCQVQTWYWFVIDRQVNKSRDKCQHNR